MTTAAYVLMRRPFAPAADRPKSVIARERRMPATLMEARKNLSNPPRIYTEIALDQIDMNISFFKNDLAAAFFRVTDLTLLAEFRQVNDSVILARVHIRSACSALSCQNPPETLRTARRLMLVRRWQTK